MTKDSKTTGTLLARIAGIGFILVGGAMVIWAKSLNATSPWAIRFDGISTVESSYKISILLLAMALLAIGIFLTKRSMDNTKRQ